LALTVFQPAAVASLLSPMLSASVSALGHAAAGPVSVGMAAKKDDAGAAMAKDGSGCDARAPAARRRHARAAAAA
jgi:hypothetical protein